MNKKIFNCIFIIFLIVFTTICFAYGKKMSLNGVALSLDIETVKKSESRGFSVKDNNIYSTAKYETLKKEKDDIKVNVKLVIKNNNTFEKAKVMIESNIPKGFRLYGDNINDKENVIVECNDTKTYNYTYYYKDSFLKDQNTGWDYDENGDLIDGSNNVRYEDTNVRESIGDKNGDIYDTEYVNKKNTESDTNRLNKGISKIIILVILFILALVALFAVIMIYRAIKGNSNDSDFNSFNVFILMLFVAIIINIIYTKSYVLATPYTPQIYEYGKSYTKVISESIVFDQLNYKFAYKVTVEYDNAYNLSDEDYEIDTDVDLLVDALEYQYMTDKNSVDTDGDGLSDYMEVMQLDYNPLSIDTFNDGINDFDRDYDIDILTNGEEILYGTNVTLVDTDYDTLTDYDEINKYNTDPTNIDTDDDGLSDSDELKLGLDPTKQMTDGVTIDSKRKIEQSCNMENIPSTLKKGEIFIKGINGEVEGVIDNIIKVHEENDSNLENSKCVVGNMFNIENENNSQITITLDATKVSDRVGYIVVCKYEDGALVPIRTTCNDDNEIVCDITSGTFCLADADLLLRELNIYNKDYKP